MTRRGEDEEVSTLYQVVYRDAETIARAEAQLEASGLSKKEVDPRRWTYLVTAARADLAALFIAEQASSEKHLSTAWRLHDVILRGNEEFARGSGLNFKEPVLVERLLTADDILECQERFSQKMRAAVADLRESNAAEYERLVAEWQRRKLTPENTLP